MTTAIPQQPTPAQIAALQRAQEENRKLKGYIAWEDRLFSNPHLSATHKLALRATRRAVQRGQTHDDQGRTRINLNTIAEQIGVSPDTVGRGLKYLESLGVVERDLKPEVQENGERWTRIYASVNEEKLQTPEKIIPDQPRNHGGPRYACPRCGNTDVIIRRRVTLVCTCGHESIISEADTRQEQDTDTGPQDAALPDEPSPESFFCEPARNLQDDLKPVSPPMPVDSSDGGADRLETSQQSQQQDNQADREAAAALLLALAGPGDEHIEMSRTSAKKYYTVYRSLTQRDTLDHLNGGKARGAWCCYPNRQTRGLAWDSDTPEGWAALQDAARALAAAGYLPLLELSPADRGGHVWIVFDTLVDVSAAKQHVYQIAPALAGVQEYWPGPEDAKRWNKVRLPGGKYIRPGVNAWCQLISVSDGETSSNGDGVARLLLAHQTPAGIVPVYAEEETPIPDVAQYDEEQAPPLGNERARTLPNEQPGGNLPAGDHQQSQGVDLQWQARYGQSDEGKRLWFAFNPQYVAAWYNAHTDLSDLLPSERNGCGLATWRGERTASVAFRGDQWTDFGASARREDGTQDSGDALELQVRLSQAPKSEIMRQAAKALLCQARTELESAARSGQPIPAWISEIITDAGRAHYERVKSDGLLDTDNPPVVQRPGMCQAGGLTGFSSALESDPAQAVPIADETFLASHKLTHGKLCKQCGCEVYRDLAGEPVCVRCYPPRGYHTYSDVIDSWYPRKRVQRWE